MFIAALFIIAKTWKQPRYPSADEWIRKPYSVINAKKQENNKMGKTRDTKGTFHAKMGSIKDRNGMVNHLQKNETRTLSNTIHKNKLKMD